MATESQASLPQLGLVFSRCPAETTIKGSDSICSLKWMTCAPRCSQSFSNCRFHSLFLQTVRIASRANSRNQASWDLLSTGHDDSIRIFFLIRTADALVQRDYSALLCHGVEVVLCSDRSHEKLQLEVQGRVDKHGHRFWRCLPYTNDLLADVCFCLCLPLHGIGLATCICELARFFICQNTNCIKNSSVFPMPHVSSLWKRFASRAHNMQSKISFHLPS